MKKYGSQEAPSFVEAATVLVQQSELRLLKSLQDHVAALEIQLQRAQFTAHGNGRRNKEGFLNRGCGCRSCVARVGRIEKKLEKARKKFQTELRRVNPYMGMEPNPADVKLLTAGD